MDLMWDRSWSFSQLSRTAAHNLSSDAEYMGWFCPYLTVSATGELLDKKPSAFQGLGALSIHIGQHSLTCLCSSLSSGRFSSSTLRFSSSLPLLHLMMSGKPKWRSYICFTHSMSVSLLTASLETSSGYGFARCMSSNRIRERTCAKNKTTM